MIGLILWVIYACLMLHTVRCCFDGEWNYILISLNGSESI